LIFQRRFDDVFPLAVAQPLSPSDVRAVVRWARTTNVPLAIRSGGHSYAGYSTGRGLVLDLRRLDEITLHRGSGVVTIGPGAQMIDVIAYLARFGRAIPTGSCASVGVGGLALGGGVGFSSRKFGTASDNIVALGIVTADGRQLRCSATENRDLFWACRGGGGGNFGVVTHFEFRSHPVDDVATFAVGWPWSQAGEVIRAWQELAPAAPDELFAMCYLVRGASDPNIEVFGQFLGPLGKLRSLLSPLLRVAGATSSFDTTSYLDAQLRWAGCSGRTVASCRLADETASGTLSRGSFAAKSDYVTSPLSPAAIGTVLEWLERPDPAGFGYGSLAFDPYGGAINRVPREATAFVHRDALFSVQYLAHWSSAAGEPAARDWLRDFHAAMRPYVSGFAYQNYIDPGLPTWRHAYYGVNYERLEQVKHEVDPDRLFTFPQAIGA
jgi:FAD/FMN-containing dehydrogenase